ncbi:MAG TPA: nitroreductase family protein [Rectinemataceae bacterium]|nr:nitroreductase family protein [Rectinemataceae bacterium]
MDLFECIGTRRSCRAYASDPVEESKLERLLEAARLAPTAANRQPFRILVIPTAGREAQLRRLYDKTWFVTAPLALLVCTIPGEAWVRKDGKNYADADAAIVMEHIVLAATALGLGSCWIASFDAEAVKEAFGLAAGMEPLAFTPIGYPKESPEPRPRKGLESLVSRL